MNKVRLRKLASVLENYATEKKKLVVPLDRFDLSAWFEHSYTEPGAKGCGTAACAVGFAMLHPWFQKQGLKPSTDVTRQPQTPDDFFDSGPATDTGYYGWGAADAFFDVPDEASSWLFSSASYTRSPRPATVAKRIREYVKTGVVPE